MVKLLSLLKAAFKVLFCQSPCVCISKPPKQRKRRKWHCNCATFTRHQQRWTPSLPNTTPLKLPTAAKGWGSSLRTAFTTRWSARVYTTSADTNSSVLAPMSAAPPTSEPHFPTPTDSCGEQIPATFSSHACSTCTSSIPNDYRQTHKLQFVRRMRFLSDWWGLHGA